MDNKDQVELYQLVFTMNWEDPGSDVLALKIKPGEILMTISSGGCNTIGFLLQDPEVIYAVDINPSQAFVLALKVAAIKHLDYGEFIRFVGLEKSKDRKLQFEKLKRHIDEETVRFWEHNIKSVEKGFLFQGRYERFVILVGKLIRMIQGRRRINGLFEDKNPEQQKAYFDKYWETKRTKYIFQLFFNKYILARKGLKADYFHFDDSATSFAESFHNKFRKVARLIPVHGNYFLHLYLKGNYRSLDELPPYLLEKNFETIKERIDRIRIITSDAKKWLSLKPDHCIDCFMLSNICELMSLDDTYKLFAEVYRTAKPGSRISFRNLMIPREIPEQMKEKIVLDKDLSRMIFDTDRAFVYSKVAAYKVFK